MSTVQGVESAIARLSPVEVREVVEWRETFLEDQRELQPEFVERLDLAQRQLARGESCLVKP